MGFLSNLISTIGSAFKKKKEPSMGDIIVKPSEVSQLSQGARYSVPETGESGVKGVSKTGGGASRSINDIIPQRNIQEELAKISTTQTQGVSTPSAVSGVQEGGSSIAPTAVKTGVAADPRVSTAAGRQEIMAQAQRDGTVTINGRMYNVQELVREFSATPLPASETALSPGESIALTAGALGAAALPAIMATATSAFSALSSYFAGIGSQATTAQGATQLASTIPQAAGIPSATTAGSIATNSATTASGIGAIAGLLKSPIGIGISVTTLLSQGASGAKTARKDASNYIKDGGELMVKLREAGMDAEADQIYNNMKDIEDDFNTLIPYIPFIGGGIETNKIQSYVDDLTYINNRYETLKLEQAKQAVLDERAYKEQQLQEQRRYEEQRLAEQRAYDEARLAEQRAYQEEREAEKTRQEQEAALASSMTELTSGSSTLNFGILNAGGDIEYVDINKASQYYFGKPYEELTFAQRRLLTLAKGTA